MSSYDDDSYDSGSYSIYSYWFPDFVYNGWREVKRFSLHIARNFNFKLNIR